MWYRVKLYNSLGRVLAEYAVITGNDIMAVESAYIQYEADVWIRPKPHARSYSVEKMPQDFQPVTVPLHWG